MLLRGKNLLKLHNCFFCHKIFKKKFLNFNFYQKIKNQHFCYLIWSVNQYKNFNFRKNFLMNSQIRNISFCDIKKY